jgi:ferritin-like metal-binding protein YciE
VAFAVLKKSGTTGEAANFLSGFAKQRNGLSIMNSITDTRAARETSNLHEPLRALFLEQLAEMESGEHQLTLALPVLIKLTQCDDLKALLQIHLTETKGHLECVQTVGDSLGEKLKSKTNHAIRDMIKETVQLAAKKLNSSVLDIALIAAAQKIEHYEIASYGTLCAWAKALDYKHELALLTSIREQEKMADMLLTGLANKRPLKELVEKTSLKKALAHSN